MKSLILLVIVSLFLLPAVSYGGKYKAEGTKFDLTSSTVPPPPPQPCTLERIWTEIDSEFYEYSEDGNPTLKKGQSEYIEVYLSGRNSCIVTGKTIEVYVENEDVVSVSPRSAASNEDGGGNRFNIKALKEGKSYIEFYSENYEVIMDLTVIPGDDIYEVMIYKNSSSVIVKDKWSFLSNGNFKSLKLGLSGTWKDLGNDSFSVKIDPRKVKNSLNAVLLKVGLDAEDSSITIKKIKILGVFQNEEIKGNLSLDCKINIKSPINTSLTSKSKLSFYGETE